ncbi:MAG: endonuclease [Crocosphaera sp.]
MKKSHIYSRIIREIFRRHYTPDADRLYFQRSEIEEVAKELNIELPKNYGDLIYSFRFRRPLPDEIRSTAPPEYEWRIELSGRANYCFTLGKINRIIPRNDLRKIKIPDATPEIISKYTSGDEQALLTKVRYNRIIDIFLGVTAYSLQNHLRTTVEGIGQIEIDEIYVGVNRHGNQFIIPVQAKGGSDQLGVVQTQQDIIYCYQKFPELICRPISTQFLDTNLIAIFELISEDETIRVVDEKHYLLVPNQDISDQELRAYKVYYD